METTEVNVKNYEINLNSREISFQNKKIKLTEKFRNYSWEKNFGYGTKAHFEGLKKFGITTHHRKGFKPIHKILSK